jgi:hypothetical protein
MKIIIDFHARLKKNLPYIRAVAPVESLASTFAFASSKTLTISVNPYHAASLKTENYTLKN